MAVPKLYTFIESGNCYKVRLLISLLGIELEQIEVDYFGKEQRQPQFLAINPRGQVPALVLEDRSLTDSAAILVYLAGTYSNRGAVKGPSSYWPNDVLKQATIMDWLAFDASWISSGLCEARYVVSFLQPENEAGASFMQKELATAQERGRRSLRILQNHLESINGSPARVRPLPISAYSPVTDWVKSIKKLDGFIPMEGLDNPMYRRK